MLDAERGVGIAPDADAWPKEAIRKVVDYADHRALGIVGWRQQATSGRIYRITIEETGESVEETDGDEG